ncbi:MAG: hypothetical protein KDK35_18970 [Leptospiraceae bacterium]|nr:hypothetical protein [Leptospiraceae bacterium]
MSRTTTLRFRSIRSARIRLTWFDYSLPSGRGHRAAHLLCLKMPQDTLTSSCIYCGRSEPAVTFASAEHVFPAGIGGKVCLARGTVCDSCNTELFSRLELAFLRNSFVSLPRQFYGPGKRGSLNPVHATPSRVHIMKATNAAGDLTLGFLRLGEPFQIPQFRWRSSDDIDVIIDPRSGETQSQLKQLVGKIRAYSAKHTLLVDPEIGAGRLLFGFHDSKYYAAVSDPGDVTLVGQLVDLLNRGKFEQRNKARYSKGQVESRQRVEIDLCGMHRVCGKIAVNAFCHLFGIAVTRSPDLAEIRKWIHAGGENSFVTLIDQDDQDLLAALAPILPEHGHIVLFASIEGVGLRALLSLYRSFTFAIHLSNAAVPIPAPAGFICDWRTGTEWALDEYLRTILPVS